MKQYDVIVIGGGPGGYECAIRMSQNGLKAALVEELKEGGLGGTCLNRGCIPTKTLLHSAEVYSNAKKAAEFGVNVENISFDYAKFKERKDKVSATLSNGIKGLCKSHGVEVIYARGTLEDRKTVALSNGEKITADKIVLATGSNPARIPIPGIDLPGVVNSTGMLDMTECPKKLVIVGGGVIGIEFASLYSTLGVEITILEMLDSILAPLDADISAAVRANLEAKGVKILNGVRVTSIEEGLKVHYADKAGKEDIAEGDVVLMAGGRRPNTKDLGLEKVGIQLTKRGHVDTDGLCRTNVPGIYAIGDINGKLELAHAASAQGMVVAAHAAGLPCKEVKREMIPSCVYTEPEVAMVGLTEKQARDTKQNVATGIFSMSGNGKAMVMGENNGMIKLVFNESTGEIYGAHLLAPRATDMIAEVVALMNAEGTIDELAHSVHPHPTVSEAIMEAAHAGRGNCVNAPKPRKKR